MASNTNQNVRRSRKLVLVGDTFSGKTSLFISFKENRFLSSHEPTILETHQISIELDGKSVDLSVFDTAGHDDFSQLRSLSYIDGDVVLLCFTVDSLISIRSLAEKWVPEIEKFSRNAPLILVACKKDLRNDERTKSISAELGRKIGADLGVDDYFECSAKTREGVEQVFLGATRLALKKRSSRRSSKKCRLS